MDTRFWKNHRGQKVSGYFWTKELVYLPSFFFRVHFVNYMLEAVGKNTHRFFQTDFRERKCFFFTNVSAKTLSRNVCQLTRLMCQWWLRERRPLLGKVKANEWWKIKVLSFWPGGPPFAWLIVFILCYVDLKWKDEKLKLVEQVAYHLSRELNDFLNLIKLKSVIKFISSPKATDTVLEVGEAGCHENIIWSMRAFSNLGILYMWVNEDILSMLDFVELFLISFPFNPLAF